MSEEIVFRYNLTRLIVNCFVQDDPQYWETIKDYIRSNKELIWGKE